MNIDQFGVVHYTTDDIADLLYENPELDISSLLVSDPSEFNQSIRSLHVNYPKLKQYVPSRKSIAEFDRHNQESWFMPEEYSKLDIAQWLLDQCHTDQELQRVGQELLMFQERNLLNLLRFMKYFVDTLRKNGVVWGVGRGSSVASYVLFLIGVHKVDALFFDLDISEFLK